MPEHAHNPTYPAGLEIDRERRGSEGDLVCGYIAFTAARTLDDVGEASSRDERRFLEMAAGRRAEQSSGGQLSQLALTDLTLVVVRRSTVRG